MVLLRSVHLDAGSYSEVSGKSLLTPVMTVSDVTGQGPSRHGAQPPPPGGQLLPCICNAAGFSERGADTPRGHAELLPPRRGSPAVCCGIRRVRPALLSPAAAEPAKCRRWGGGEPGTGVSAEGQGRACGLILNTLRLPPLGLRWTSGTEVYFWLQRRMAELMAKNSVPGLVLKAVRGFIK